MWRHLKRHIISIQSKGGKKKTNHPNSAHPKTAVRSHGLTTVPLATSIPHRHRKPAAEVEGVRPRCVWNQWLKKMPRARHPACLFYISQSRQEGYTREGSSPPLFEVRHQASYPPHPDRHHTLHHTNPKTPHKSKYHPPIKSADGMPGRG